MIYPSIRAALAPSLMLLIVFLSACTTLDPYTGEKKTSNAAKGAGIGAATGVAVGIITGDDSAER